MEEASGVADKLQIMGMTISNLTFAQEGVLFCIRQSLAVDRIEQHVSQLPSQLFKRHFPISRTIFFATFDTFQLPVQASILRPLIDTFVAPYAPV